MLQKLPNSYFTFRKIRIVFWVERLMEL
uniref:Uncharacterized protein n=1 Tax=Lepeophtheirus salmonis TaxID=72036 RepID=A0A0K2VL05_LEPSM